AGTSLSAAYTLPGASTARPVSRRPGNIVGPEPSTARVDCVPSGAILLTSPVVSIDTYVLPCLSILMDSGKFGGANVTTGETDEAAYAATESSVAAATFTTLRNTNGGQIQARVNMTSAPFEA